MQASDESRTLFDAAEIDFKACRYRDAATKYRKSIDAGPTSLTYERLCLALYQVSDFESAAVAGVEGIRLAKQTADRKSEADIQTLLGVICLATGKLDDALYAHKEALVIYGSLNNLQGKANALQNIGNVYRRKGDAKEASSCYGDALKIHIKCNNLPGQAHAIGAIGNLHLEQKRFAQALKAYEQELEIRGNMDDPQQEARSLNNIGCAYLGQAEYDKSLVKFQKAAEIFKAINNMRGYADATANIGSVYLKQGKYGEALNKLKETRSSLVTIDSDFRIRQQVEKAMTAAAQEVGKIASHYASQERFDDALTLYEQVLECSKELENSSLEALCYINTGVIYKNRGNHIKAVECYEIALNIGKNKPDLSVQAIALANLGFVYSEAGEFAAAWEHLRGAEVMYTRIGTDPEKMNILHQAARKVCVDFAKAARECLEGGKLENALGIYQTLLEYTRKLGELELQADCLGFIGITFLSMRNREQAIMSLKEARSIYLSIGNMEAAAAFSQELNNLAADT
jgi:tetratricopeptide (TPR) repeat protein